MWNLFQSREERKLRLAEEQFARMEAKEKSKQNKGLTPKKEPGTFLIYQDNVAFQNTETPKKESMAMTGRKQSAATLAATKKKQQADRFRKSAAAKSTVKYGYSNRLANYLMVKVTWKGRRESCNGQEITRKSDSKRNTEARGGGRTGERG